MNGPLEPYRQGFTADLGRLGYSKFTVVALLHLMAHLSRWLVDQGLGAGDLTDACVERFLATRRASGQVCRLSPRGLIPLLEYLRGLNVAPDPVPPVASTPSERLLEEFTGFLLHQRGLARGTVTSYQWMAQAFSVGSGATGPRFGPSWSRRHIRFPAHRSQPTQCRLAQQYGDGVAGRCFISCTCAATPRGRWQRRCRGAATRWSGPPQPLLDGDDVTRLLASCDRRTNAGRRDYALLTVLARLGTARRRSRRAERR